MEAPNMWHFGHKGEHPVIHTENFGVVQALRCGEINCICAQHNDAECGVLIWQQPHIIEERGFLVSG